MRARHPSWFREDLERLFELLANRAIQPRVAERISFAKVAEAHRRLEAGGLEGSSCCARIFRRAINESSSSRFRHRDFMCRQAHSFCRDLRQG